MTKSVYLQQLDAHDKSRIGYLQMLLEKFRTQPPLDYRPHAILDWGIGSNGIWVLVDNGRYSQDYTFRGPMIFVSDDGRLYRTSRRLKFKNGHVLDADSSHITEHWVNPERLTLDEVNECIRELEELIAHERNRQEREEALMSKQLD